MFYSNASNSFNLSLVGSKIDNVSLARIVETPSGIIPELKLVIEFTFA